MDKLGKFLQRDLVNASPSRFLMDDVKENEMASSLPQNVTADYVRAIGSDGKSYRIPKADFASIIRSELGTILNGLSDQQTVTKVPTLNGSTLGASAVATLASVLGVIRYIGDINSSSNIDDLVSGWYRISTTTPPNWWFNNSSADGLVEFIKTHANYKMLRYTSFTNGDVYECYYLWTSWSDWKKFTAGTL